jgi:hypothetical protein
VDDDVEGVGPVLDRVERRRLIYSPLTFFVDVGDVSIFMSEASDVVSAGTTSLTLVLVALSLLLDAMGDRFEID